MDNPRHLDPDGVLLLLAALVRQAVADHRAGYTKHGRPDAATFFRAAGLLTPDGTLDARFKRRPRQSRPGRAATAAP